MAGSAPAFVHAQQHPARNCLGSWVGHFARVRGIGLRCPPHYWAATIFLCCLCCLLFNLMKLLDVPLGLLINFHEMKVTDGISRLILPGANL